MLKRNQEKQFQYRQVEKKLRRQRRLGIRSRRRVTSSPARMAPSAAATARRPRTSRTSPGLRRWNMRGTAFVVVCLACVIGLSIAACAGSKPRPQSFREQSVEITKIPNDAVFYLSEIQGSPLVETDASGKVIGSTAYHPYGAVRFQKGRTGDPWGFVGNEEDRGSALSDFHARPYRPELGIFGSVDPQALFHPEKIIGQPSRMFPYAYSAGNPISQLDKDGRDYKFAVEGTHITITVPVVFYGKVTQVDVVSMQKSFESVWNQSPHSYRFNPKGPEYDVTFKLDGVIGKGPTPGKPGPKGVNSISIVPGRYLDGPNGVDIGGVDCYHGVGCRTGSFPVERLNDKTLIGHELGHLMGLDHIDDESNIMHRTNDGPKDKKVWQTQINQIADRGMMLKPAKAERFEYVADTEPPEKGAPK